jgi:hypothetical protein
MLGVIITRSSRMSCVVFSLFVLASLDRSFTRAVLLSQHHAAQPKLKSQP